MYVLSSVVAVCFVCFFFGGGGVEGGLCVGAFCAHALFSSVMFFSS